jgi:hypothetical protein
MHRYDINLLNNLSKYHNRVYHTGNKLFHTYASTIKNLSWYKGVYANIVTVLPHSLYSIQESACIKILCENTDIKTVCFCHLIILFTLTKYVLFIYIYVWNIVLAYNMFYLVLVLFKDL